MTIVIVVIISAGWTDTRFPVCCGYRAVNRAGISGDRRKGKGSSGGAISAKMTVHEPFGGWSPTRRRRRAGIAIDLLTWQFTSAIDTSPQLPEKPRT